MKEEGECIRTICWVETAGGIEREMEGDRRISQELEVAGKNTSKENAAISARSHEIPFFRWSNLPEAENP